MVSVQTPSSLQGTRSSPSDDSVESRFGDVLKVFRPLGRRFVFFEVLGFSFHDQQPLYLVDFGLNGAKSTPYIGEKMGQDETEELSS